MMFSLSLFLLLFSLMEFSLLSNSYWLDVHISVQNQGFFIISCKYTHMYLYIIYVYLFTFGE